jgi:aldose 1-epimerase
MKTMQIIIGALAMITTAPSFAASAKREPFGAMADGRAVEAVVLTNASGMSARVISFGATLQALEVPDRGGKPGDVVLGYGDMRGYNAKPNYFGSSVGRYANRIGGARFKLDGRAYALTKNDGPNTLHGGAAGFDKRLWTITAVESGPVARVVMTYRSPAGEEGYPGTLDVTAIYSLGEANELTIEYRARTTAPTIVNLTHHSYFTLAGEGGGRGTMNQRLTIPAESFTPVDATLIPTGEVRAVAGTNFDFRNPTVIGSRIRDGRDAQLVYGRGYDHNWVIQHGVSDDLKLHARLEDPFSGRVMELLSNQPGLQFYSGNFIDATITGKSGSIYRQGDGLCLEPQLFPDTPNKPQFGSARLNPGQSYVNHMVLRFSTKPAPTQGNAP